MGDISKLKVGATTITSIPDVYAVLCNGEVYYVNQTTFEGKLGDFPATWFNTPSLSLIYNTRDAYNSSRTNYLGKRTYDELKIDLSIKDNKAFTFHFDNLGTGQTKFDGKEVSFSVIKFGDKSRLIMYGGIKKALIDFSATYCTYEITEGSSATVTSDYTSNDVILHIRPYTKESNSDYPIVLRGGYSNGTSLQVYLSWGLTLEEYIKYNRTVENRLSVTISYEQEKNEPAGFLQTKTAFYQWY